MVRSFGFKLGGWWLVPGWCLMPFPGGLLAFPATVSPPCWPPWPRPAATCTMWSLPPLQKISTYIALRCLFPAPPCSHVYNVEPPASASEYLHRAGRSGRIGSAVQGAPRAGMGRGCVGVGWQQTGHGDAKCANQAALWIAAEAGCWPGCGRCGSTGARQCPDQIIQPVPPPRCPFRRRGDHARHA